jgi:hypothetical protein
MKNICFIQKLYSNRIQAIVQSQNNENVDNITEQALEEESTIVSKDERYSGGQYHQLAVKNVGS